MIRKEKENWSKEFKGIQLECDDGRQEHLPEMLTDKYCSKLDNEVNKEFRHQREQLFWNEKWSFFFRQQMYRISAEHQKAKVNRVE